jgi:hypothetical protein
MLTAQAFRFLCISVTLGLSGCVTQSGEAGSGTRNVLCQKARSAPALTYRAVRLGIFLPALWRAAIYKDTGKGSNRMPAPSASAVAEW